MPVGDCAQLLAKCFNLRSQRVHRAGNLGDLLVKHAEPPLMRQMVKLRFRGKSSHGFAP